MRKAGGGGDFCGPIFAAPSMDGGSWGQGLGFYCWHPYLQEQTVLQTVLQWHLLLVFIHIISSLEGSCFMDPASLGDMTLGELLDGLSI